METDNPLIHELFEANSELARHHRDFERIRNIVDKALADGIIDHQQEQNMVIFLGKLGILLDEQEIGIH